MHAWGVKLRNRLIVVALRNEDGRMEQKRARLKRDRAIVMGAPRPTIKDIAERAVHILIERAADDDAEFEPLAHELIVRESTAAPVQHHRA